jgi:hypothetical protein
MICPVARDCREMQVCSGSLTGAAVATAAGMAQAPRRSHPLAARFSACNPAAATDSRTIPHACKQHGV